MTSTRQHPTTCHVCNAEVFVVTVQVMRHHLHGQPGAVGGETARLRDRRSLGILENPCEGGFT